MNNISVSCGEMERVVYKLPSDLLNHTLSGVCEQNWFSEDGRLIADPSYPETLSDPAISVSSDRLVTSRCVNVLHEILCDASGSHHSLQTMFRVRNETAATPNSDVNELTPSLQISDQLWWLFALFIFIFIIFICFILRKRIFRCFQREARFICPTDDDPDNRDLKVGSDDPHSPNEHQKEC